MPSIGTAESFGELIADRIRAERVALSSQWLQRLVQLLPVDATEVFPTEKLLDHIPLLLDEIAEYVRVPADAEISANAGVIDKARELGQLRHEQRASVHQLLREYEILAEILESFVAAETARLGLDPASAACFNVMQRLTRSVRALMRTTVDTFISQYTTTIEAQTEQLKRFNRMASHELRSPVGTILVAAALLQRDDARRDAQRVTKIVTTIRTNAERLTFLLENLRRVAGLDRPLDGPSSQFVEVAAIAREVARQLEEMARARGVGVRVDDALPALVLDPAHLELTLINLVSNGIKYSDPAKPDRYVDIAYGGATEAGHCIIVRDNGLGIPDDAKPALFTRFVRAHTERDAELGVDGLGLGLTIAAECVDALGGTIRFDSTPGIGTVFFIELPDTTSRGTAITNGAC